jgi:DNA-directed RNA polymerase specialized sigma subunit
MKKMERIAVLNSYYEEYESDRIDMQTLVCRVFQYALNHAWTFGVHCVNQDECADFLGWYYPRLVSAIERYEPKPAGSFGIYINMMIRLAFKEYRRDEAIHTAAEEAYWHEKAYEISLSQWGSCEKEEEPLDCVADSCGKAHEKLQNPRQILMLMLKSYYRLDESMIEKAAPMLGMNSGQLNDMLDHIRQIRFEKDNSIAILKERIHSQYYKCVSYERRLALLSANHNQLRERLLKKMELGRKRLEAMRRRLAETNMDASNSQIARVLGLTKSTVDTSMHKLKKNAVQGKQKRGRKKKNTGGEE